MEHLGNMFGKLYDFNCTASCAANPDSQTPYDCYSPDFGWCLPFENAGQCGMEMEPCDSEIQKTDDDITITDADAIKEEMMLM